MSVMNICKKYCLINHIVFEVKEKNGWTIMTFDDMEYHTKRIDKVTFKQIKKFIESNKKRTVCYQCNTEITKKHAVCSNCFDTICMNCFVNVLVFFNMAFVCKQCNYSCKRVVIDTEELADED